jgi:multiple sugar transport system substrate-binding protein
MFSASIKASLGIALLSCVTTTLLSAKTTLTWIDYQINDKVYNDLIGQDFQEYSALHPDIDFKRSVIPQGEFKSKLIQATATKTIPDLILLDNPDNQALAAQGTVADITDKVKAWPYKYFPGPWSSTLYNGRNYGLPMFSNTLGVWYNRTLLQKAGLDSLPVTWDEFRAAAKKLTGNGIYGLCLSAAPNEVGTFTLLPFLWSAGTDLNQLSSPAALKALSYIHDLVLTDKSVSRSIVNWGPSDLTNAWTAGRAAMMINGSWEIPNIRSAKLNYKWVVGPLPKDLESVSILGGENLALGNGNNIEEAWKFVEWLNEPARAKALIVAAGQITNREDLAEDLVWAQDPVEKIFLAAIRSAKARAYGPKYPQISEIMYTTFQSIVTGSMTQSKRPKTLKNNCNPFWIRLAVEIGTGGVVIGAVNNGSKKEPVT